MKTGEDFWLYEFIAIVVTTETKSQIFDQFHSSKKSVRIGPRVRTRVGPFAAFNYLTRSSIDEKNHTIIENNGAPHRALIVLSTSYPII